MAQQPDLRSLEMAFQAFTDYESVSIPIRGAIEDIDRVTLEDIRSLYSRLMKTPCEMISCGTFSEEFSRHIDRSIDSQDIYTTWEKLKRFQRLFASAKSGKSRRAPSVRCTRRTFFPTMTTTMRFLFSTRF
nr:hypothetical protein [Allobaculum sp. Allo2]